MSSFTSSLARKLFVGAVLIVAGFAGGLVLTARLRPESRAEVLSAPLSAAPQRVAPSTHARGSTAPPAAAAPVVASGPDFTRVAGQAVKGVANISSLQVVRTPNSPFANDPFFRYFFGERRRVRLARPPIAQPRLGRGHFL